VFAVLPLTAGAGVTLNEATMMKLCEVLVDYNAHKTYDAKSFTDTAGPGQAGKANCHALAESILKTVMPRTQQDECWLLTGQHTGVAMWEYLQRVRLDASQWGRMWFQRRNEAKEIVYFQTHAELDAFAKHALATNEIRESSSEWLLLKAFDRAFWLRNLLRIECRADGKSGASPETGVVSTGARGACRDASKCTCCPFRPVNLTIGTAEMEEPNATVDLIKKKRRGARPTYQIEKRERERGIAVKSRTARSWHSCTSR